MVKITCTRSGKQVYATVARAEYFAAKLTGQERRPYRIYRCTFCGFWHLTSKLPAGR